MPTRTEVKHVPSPKRVRINISLQPDSKTDLELARFQLPGIYGKIQRKEMLTDEEQMLWTVFGSAYVPGRG